MPSILIDNIKTLDKKSQPEDLQKDVAVELKNLLPSKTPGVLSKAGSYSDAATSLFGQALPSLSIKNVAEFNLTRPSETETYLFHSQESGVDKLYHGKYWDGSAFQNGLREITENLATQFTLTATDVSAGTDASTIVIDSTNGDYGELSTTNDYYNGWIVTIDIAAGTKAAALVTDYTYDSGAGTKTFAFKTNSLTNIAAADTFYLARQQVIADDAASADIGGINSVDDNIRFNFRENQAICMTGSTNPFPTQYQLWYGYVNRYFGDQQFNDFWLDTQQMLAPYIDNSPSSPQQSLVTVTTAGGGSLVADDYHIYFAYEYDGFQIGPLSDPLTITVSSNGKIAFAIKIPYSGCYDATDTKYYKAFAGTKGTDIPPDYSQFLISRRITGLRAYIKTGTTTDNVSPTLIDFWALDGSTLYSRSSLLISSGIANDPEALFSLGTEGLLELDYTVEIYGPSYYAAGTTYATDVGQTGLNTNFKYSAAVENHLIVANIRNEDGEREQNDLIASTIQADGTAAIDNFGASNAINLGHFGSNKITGLGIIGDVGTTTSPKRRIAVFTDDELYVLTITAGSSFSFSMDRIGAREGMVAPDSLVSVPVEAGLNMMAYVSRNGFRLLDSNGSRKIGFGLQDQFDALTTVTDAIGGFLKRENLIIWVFPTDGNVFVCDLNNKLEMYQFTYADTMVSLISSHTGELYAASATKIYKLEDGNDQDGTGQTPQFKSKLFTSQDFGIPGKRLYFASNELKNFVRYNSSTAVDWKFYVDGSQVTLGGSKTFSSNNVDDEFYFPLGTNGETFQVEATLTAGNASSNTTFEIGRIFISAELKNKLGL